MSKAESRNHVFALQIEDSDHFIDIFGSAISSMVWDDILGEYTNITKKILANYTILSAVVAPFWGRCFRPFALNHQPIPMDMKEQVSALTAAGTQFIREMLQHKLGTPTGAKLNFKITITPIQEDYRDIQGINETLTKLFKTLPRSSYPVSPISAHQLVKIIENRGVETFFQPIVSLPEERIVGYEALSRASVNGSLHEADLLFGTAAHLGLTDELELVCVEKALDWMTEIPALLWMSVNIGPSLLKSAAFSDLISQERVKPYWPRLIFELTEHLPIDSVMELDETVQDLKDRGISLSLDDTGCGFFDLYAVEKFRPKIVKVCITVIRRIGRSDEILAEFTEALSRISEFGEYVLGEGVEQKAQLDVLNQCGVPMAQGYYFDKPKPAKDVFKSGPSPV
ncbi:MAG: EAL domain-containing protein [Thermodesulfobacteriota bacterium]|nr:EAL domain-containing protein [Thermodesulfobacteriota bacterium]